MSVQAQEDDLNTSAASQSEAPLLPASVAEVIDRSDPIVHSCPSSACITPLPVKKLNPPDSDTGTDLLPVCRICQLPGDKDDFLFSPCRCSGTMMFVHYLCLLKWIEVSSRRTKKTPKCELCHFQYIRHKRFKVILIVKIV
ncbi:E3 ubiquitin-protein ligase MARCH8-like [Pomacea canaliculata]|uniref:E3 ubiquitin-protein ligase MARCH8-like n=1 Tax=Pomacea canaliculata TaxID=400727 RepID=UPI000D73383F|nr:E3 ubiquitin-protein ligase MARCH8-like [Pomacea canaliculata]